MGLLAKLFGAVPRSEMRGIHLDVTRPFWEAFGKTDFGSLLGALGELLTGDCVLYFEGGSPSGELSKFLRGHSVPERAHVAYGTIWPKPSVFHVPATQDAVSHLVQLMRSRVSPELAVHFHVYRDQTVLLEWHDAFAQPMLLSGELSEQKVRAFVERLGISFKRLEGVEQRSQGNRAKK